MTHNLLSSEPGPNCDRTGLTGLQSELALYQTPPAAGLSNFGPLTSHLESAIAPYQHPSISNIASFVFNEQLLPGMAAGAPSTEAMEGVESAQSASKPKGKATPKAASRTSGNVTEKTTSAKTKKGSANVGQGPALPTPAGAASSLPEVVCPLPNKTTGQTCLKKCIGDKRFRSIQEHIRRAHPEYYIKLSATEESFNTMINTPPHELPADPPAENGTASNNLNFNGVTLPHNFTQQVQQSRKTHAGALALPQPNSGQSFGSQQASTARFQPIHPIHNSGSSDVDMSVYDDVSSFQAPADNFSSGAFALNGSETQRLGTLSQGHLISSDMEADASVGPSAPTSFFTDSFEPGPSEIPVTYGESSAIDPALDPSSFDGPLPRGPFADLSDNPDSGLFTAASDALTDLNNAAAYLGSQDFNADFENEHAASGSPGTTQASSIDHSSPETPAEIPSSHNTGLEALAAAAAARAPSKSGSPSLGMLMDFVKTDSQPKLLSSVEKYSYFPNLRSFESAVTNPTPPRNDDRTAEATNISDAYHSPSAQGHGPREIGGVGEDTRRSEDVDMEDGSSGIFPANSSDGKLSWVENVILDGPLVPASAQDPNMSLPLPALQQPAFEQPMLQQPVLQHQGPVASDVDSEAMDVDPSPSAPSQYPASQFDNHCTGYANITFDPASTDPASPYFSVPEPGTPIHEYVCIKLAFLTRKSRLNMTARLGGDIVSDEQRGSMLEDVERLRRLAIDLWHDLNTDGSRHDEEGLAYLVAV